MSKRYKMPPVDFQDFLDKEEVEGAIPFTLGGREFVLKPPTLLPDDRAREFLQLEGVDAEAQARILMGDDYDEFVAKGGNALALMKFISQQLAAQEAAQGADSGESEASSTS
jgi:hypothetical protein